MFIHACSAEWLLQTLTQSNAVVLKLYLLDMAFPKVDMHSGRHGQVEVKRSRSAYIELQGLDVEHRAATSTSGSSSDIKVKVSTALIECNVFNPRVIYTVYICLYWTSVCAPWLILTFCCWRQIDRETDRQTERQIYRPNGWFKYRHRDRYAIVGVAKPFADSHVTGLWRDWMMTPERRETSNVKKFLFTRFDCLFILISMLPCIVQ